MRKRLLKKRAKVRAAALKHYSVQWHLDHPGLEHWTLVSFHWYPGGASIEFQEPPSNKETQKP